jgi:hypothetical protein
MCEREEIAESSLWELSVSYLLAICYQIAICEREEIADSSLSVKGNR